jgi:hypothetical protein
MSMLALVPAPYRWVAILLAFAATFFYGAVVGARHEETVRDAREAKQVQQQLQAQIAATQHTLTEEHRRTDAVQEITNETHREAEHYQSLADGNRAAGQLLRDQLAAASSTCPAQPATAAGSAPASAAPDLLADVQRRLAEAEDRTVEFADASRRAGIACERSYDSSTHATNP